MSSVVDEDTVRTINTGRETAGAILSNAQDQLQKVFLVFVAGFLGSFYLLRIWIWDFLKATAQANMEGDLAGQTDVITRTPFEVILLQAKIGMLVGVIVAIPAVLYYSRDALRERGFQSAVPISRAYLAAFALTSIGLFTGGVVYAYGVFFPFAFDFLAGNAANAGIKPSFGITEFTQFMALLTLSFGLAAQLPLFMGVLAYTEIVPYETFRDKWRHAVVGISVFGALFSPPDPFTLVMWAMPMVALYGFSLGLAKVVTNVRRSGAAGDPTEGNALERRVLKNGALVGLVGLLAAIGTAAEGGTVLEEELLPMLPEAYRPATPLWPTAVVAEHGVVVGGLIVGAVTAAVVGVVFLAFNTIRVFKGPVYPREQTLRSGDPEDIDFDVLDAQGVKAAPTQAFLAMDEEEALEHARQAMYDDDKEKAEAILDRFDRLEQASVPDAGSGEGSDGDASSGGTRGAEAESEESSTFTSTAAGMVDPFTEDETTEDDIGGYYYDIAFILESLTSKMFRIVATFMIVMGGTFIWLYQGGIGDVLLLFLERVPEEILYDVATRNEVDPEGMTTEQLLDQLDIVIALHPVEVLIFEVKVSTLAAIISVLPLVLYYAWPAAKERGLVRGDRRVFAVWAGTLLAGFALGTYLGFFYIAPAIISYLVSDAISAGMVISYRIKSFFWLVILTTVGVGFLMNIVATMLLFHVGGIVDYRTMLGNWRPVVVGIFAFAAVATPKGILTMLVIAAPIAFTYVLGLALLYVLTFGGRLFGGGGASSVDAEPESEPDAGAAAE